MIKVEPNQHAMAMHPTFGIVFDKLYGHPCWGVKPGIGSSLTMEFGEPHLEIREPIAPTTNVSPKVRRILESRNVTVSGEWHLWIFCCDWGVFSGNKLVGGASSRRRINRAADFLDGQKLVQAEIIRRGCRTFFTFDLGGRLETRPYDRQGEQWQLFEPSGNVLTLRADKRFSYHPGDFPPDKVQWHPFESTG